jgi:hypothetical protein
LASAIATIIVIWRAGGGFATAISTHYDGEESEIRARPSKIGMLGLKNQ